MESSSNVTGKILAVLCLVLVVGALVFFVRPMLGGGGTAAATTAPTVWEEIAQRMEGTPLDMFSILSRSLENGVTELSLDIIDNSPWNTSGSLSGRFYSNVAREQFALVGEFESDFLDISFEAYIDSERVAARIPALGNDALGIRFSTFRDDLYAFLSRIDPTFTRAEVDAEIDFLVGEFIAGFEMGSGMAFDEFLALIEENPEALFGAYDIDWSIYLAALEPIQTGRGTPTSETIQINGTYVEVERVTYAFGANELFDAILILMDVFEQWYEDTFDMSFASVDTFDDFGELRREIANVRREIAGTNERADFEVAVYTNSAGRLVRLAGNMEFVERWGTTTTANFILCFGNSATDTWTFTLAVYEDGRHEFTLNLAWEMSNNGPATEHRFVANTNNRRDGELSYAAGFTWNRSTGMLTFYAEELGTRTNRASVSANLIMTGNNFRLRINNWEIDRFTTINIELAAEVGVPVPTINNVVNLDQWDEEIFYIIDDLLWALGW